MFGWSSEKTAVLTEIADGFLAVYPRGRTILAVDGPHDVARKAFADDLATVFEQRGVTVFRASLDGFCAPSSTRYLLGRYNPEGYLAYAYDEALLRRTLIDPFKLGGSTGFELESFDKRRDQPVEPKWITGPPDAVLIIDGPFLHRSTLRGVWNQSLWLFSDSVAEGEAAQSSRNLDTHTPPSDALRASQERNAEADRLYQQRVNPGRLATVAVDVTDPLRPRRAYLDYC
ncbi:uridine kinase [Lysinibacter cavernae]|uniref:Uridine kinase n=1 Tax=Lysinibacter cavernae TaxID=1640652 RepID=A0A7X5R190_9MICO|nr:uridine kinase [Lysinibacter cavernae]NIH53582.1 uridine kinase [Lysinibacter cavernae]